VGGLTHAAVDALTWVTSATQAGCSGVTSGVTSHAVNMDCVGANCMLLLLLPLQGGDAVVAGIHTTRVFLRTAHVQTL
jgi:hypothetical protein